eukprot:TRINITY_DN35955_c0_g1_i2.p1 TRINITY_DN35955_c0_g1~~TRINITY_DN35955_c0_g1_i2.p1  ORF type:complete len:313 (+),score=63.13 TRINITY_DN35955_c0_g1_i2:90-1028(+)
MMPAAGISPQVRFTIVRWSVFTAELLVIIFIAVVLLVMGIGRIPDRIRRRRVCIAQHFPKFKLPLKSPMAISVCLAAIFAFCHQLMRSVAIANPDLMKTHCDAFARVSGTFLFTAYFFMLRVLVIRTRSAELPFESPSKFEKLLNWIVWGFAVVVVGFPIASRGVAFVQEDVQGHMVYVCTVQLNFLAVNLTFAVFDVFVTLSLLALFYKRLRGFALGSDSMAQDSRQKYLRIARHNLISSGITLGCTLTITWLTAFTGDLAYSYGAFALGFELVNSACLAIIVICFLGIFKNAFEWPKPAEEPPRPTEEKA